MIEQDFIKNIMLQKIDSTLLYGLQKIDHYGYLGEALNLFASKAPDGLYLEFGVATGFTIKNIAAATQNKVYGFDSFEGLPEDWEGYQEKKGAFKCAIPKDLPSNVELLVGLFDETIPKFIEQHKNEKVAYMHVDCDIYSSTKCIFDNFKNMFQDGSVICFDELVHYPGWEINEWKAWHEFLEETKYKWEVLGKYAPHQVAFKIHK